LNHLNILAGLWQKGYTFSSYCVALNESFVTADVGPDFANRSSLAAGCVQTLVWNHLRGISGNGGVEDTIAKDCKSGFSIWLIDKGRGFFNCSWVKSMETEYPSRATRSILTENNMCNCS